MALEGLAAMANDGPPASGPSQAGSTMHPALKAAWGSLGVGAAAGTLKAAAWWSTGSVALYSDALESLVNIAGACAALIALRISHRPPDADYPYGYHKAEHLSAIAEALMVLAAAIAILYEACTAFHQPRDLTAPWQGLLLNGLGSALNAGWGIWLLAMARIWKSPAVQASGKHLLSDVLTSAGVVAGLGLALATGWTWADPIIAGVVAAHIGYIGVGMASDALGGLMDRADTKVARSIEALFASYGEGLVEARAIRTRQAGARIFAEFELAVPAGMSVAEAHRICMRVEAALKAEFGDTVVAFHFDPGEAEPAATSLLN